MISGRQWAHELSAGIAAAWGWFDAPKVIDEQLLASTIRKIATEIDDLGQMLFLRSMADALDHPAAERRLRLSKAKPGRPSGELVERAFMVGPRVTKLVRDGVKKEAAIQQAMSDYGLSRSAVIRSTSQYEDYRRIFEPGDSDSILRNTAHDIVLEADERRGRLIAHKRKSSKKAGD